jgi:hypothetical protein
MKFLTTLFVAGFLAAGAAYAADDKAAPETKRVCVDIQGKDGKPVIDPKTKKPRQDCKTVTIRKKHEGTTVPDGKKK